MRDDFQKFINKSARLVERAVYETDIFVDYSGQDDGDKDRYVFVEFKGEGRPKS